MTEHVFLNPGDLYFGRGEVRVETLLGPCVAIVMWYPGLNTGGMCHFQLPGVAAVAGVEADGRYGVQAWHWLEQQARNHGLSPEQGQYKLFGGARSFTHPSAHLALDVAAQNVAFVQRLMAARKLRVIAQDLGGEGYRYVRFELHSGDVWVRRGMGLYSVQPEVRR